MSEINFFKPIVYGSNAKTATEKAIENVDSYFHINGKQAFILPNRIEGGKQVVLLADESKFYNRFTLEIRISNCFKIVGIALTYFTVVIPLAMFITKVALRATHSYKFITPKEDLEKGINISQKTLEKLKTLMPQILQKKDHPEIEWLDEKQKFKLKDHLNLVFNFPGGYLKAILRDKITAKQVCLIYNLGLLVIPHAKKFTINADGEECGFIVEESLDFNPNKDAQEQLYRTCSTKLNDTIRQLAIYIRKAGLRCRPPILNETQDYLGSRRVALIDPSYRSLGNSDDYQFLINHLFDEEQMNIVIDESNKEELPLLPYIGEEEIRQNEKKQVKESKEKRLSDLEFSEKLQQLLRPGKLLEVKLEDLGLNLNEEDEIKGEEITREYRSYEPEKQIETITFVNEQKKVTMKKVAEDIIAEINNLISNPRQAPLNEAFRNEPLWVYKNLGSKYNKCSKYNKYWKARIIDALLAAKKAPASAP